MQVRAAAPGKRRTTATRREQFKFVRNGTAWAAHTKQQGKARSGHHRRSIMAVAIGPAPHRVAAQSPVISRRRRARGNRERLAPHRGRPHHQVRSHEQGVADVRRLLVAGRRPVREDRRHGVRRARPERPAQRRHHRHQARAAQRQRQGRVLAQLLHPEAARPVRRATTRSCTTRPNRGSKTFSALNRGVSGDDPGSVTDAQALSQHVPVAERLHAALRAAGTRRRAPSTGELQLDRSSCPSPRIRTARTITGPAYEYIVIGRRVGARSTIRRPRSTSRRRSSRTACISTTRRKWCPSTRLELQRRRHGDQPRRRQLRQQRHLRVQLHGQGSHGQRHRLRGDARLHGVAALRGEGRLRHRQSAGRRHHPHLHRSHVAAGAHAERLPHARLQRGREGNRKVFDAIFNWVGAANGINMNYRFSHPGTTQRNRQDQLYPEAFFPFANESIDRSHQRHHGRALRQVQRDQHLPVGDGGLLVERILGQDRLAVPHQHARHGRPAGTSARAAVSHLEPSALATRQRELEGQLPAIRQSARVRAGAARAVGSDGPVVDERRRAAAAAWSRASPTERWCRRCRRARLGLPEHPGRHVHGAQVDALPLQLRARTSTPRA